MHQKARSVELERRPVIIEDSVLVRRMAKALLEEPMSQWHSPQELT